MKKKHLQALNSVENWFKKDNSMTSELKTAFEAIKKAIEGVVETQRKPLEELPIPQEISGEPNILALYSDGGCRGNPGPGAFAYVVQAPSGDVVVEGVEFEVHTTNNKMELSGPLRGLQELQSNLVKSGQEPLLMKVRVVTDSKYVVDGMKTWVKGWKARDWKKADNKAPENLELWQALDKVRDNFLEVDWVWVKGHGGHPQNEYCDKKANQVMDENIS